MASSLSRNANDGGYKRFGLLLFLKKALTGLIGERDDNFTRLHFDTPGIFLRQRFAFTAVFTQNVSGALIK